MRNNAPDSNHTSNVLAMNLIILVLGMVLITQFYSLLFHHSFTSAGWENLLSELKKFNDVHSFKYQLIIFLENTAPFSTYLFAGGLLISGLACTMLLARYYICLMVSLFFFIAWSLNWNDPGMWFFEFVFPSVFALLAGLSMRPFSFGPQSIFLQLGFTFRKTCLYLLLLSILLYYVTYIAFKDPDFAYKTALASSLSFFIVNLLAFYILRKQPDKRCLEKDNLGNIDRYLDVFIVIVGAMLLLQVYTNYFTQVFELSNFRDNLTYFAKASSAFWLHPILHFTVDNSKWILPVYIVFEIFLSVSLIFLLMRGPLMLVASGLLGFLAFSELGASAVWPPDSHVLTWQWELLFATAVSFIIAVQKIVMLVKTFSLKKLILGDPIYDRSISLYIIVLISIICGVLLYLIGIAGHGYIGEAYRIISIYSGVTFAILIFILLMTNNLRK